MAKLDSLLVDMQVNTAELRRGLDQAKGHLHSFGETVKEIKEKLEALAVFEIGKDLVKELGEFVLKGAEAADQMGKLAQSAGVSTETFSRLNYAAGLSHVSTEELSTAFKKLDVNLAKAGAGVNEQVALFQALGIKVTDAGGKLRGTEAVFNDVVKVFSGFQDGASKSALAVELLGKAGDHLIPFFNEGTEGIKKLSDEADRFGVTVTAAAAKSSQEFVDNIERLHRASTAVATQLAAKLAPALKQLTDELLNSKEGADLLKGAVEVLATTFRVLMSVGAVVGEIFNRIGQTLGAVTAAIVEVVQGNFAGALDGLKGYWRDISEGDQNLVNRLKAIWSDGTGAEEALKKEGDAHKKSADAAVQSFERKKKAFEEYKAAIKELTKVAEELEAQVAGFGQSPLEEFVAKLDVGPLAEQLKKAGDRATEFRDRLIEAFSKLQELKAQKVSVQLDFEINQKRRETTSDLNSRRLAFDNIGANAQTVLAQKTAGFSSFEDALDRLAKETDKQNRKLAEAQMLKLDGDEEGARRAEALATIYGRSVENAKTAAQGFQELAELDYQTMVENVQNALGAISSLAGQLLSKMGDLGSVIQAGIQGFQQGGWWGALAAVMLEIVSRFERFKEVTDISNKVLFDLIEALKPGLNRLVTGFDDFMQAIDGLAGVLGNVLNGALGEVGRMLGHIGRFLGPLAKMLDAITGPMSGIMDAFEGLIDILDPMLPILKLVGALFSLIGIAFLKLWEGVQLGLYKILEWFRQLLQDLHLDSLAMEISKVAVKMHEGAQTAHDKADAMWNSLGQQFSSPEAFFGTDNKVQEDIKTDVTDKATVSVGNFATATETATTAISKMTQQLTNVPQGFRINLARYNATAPVGGMGGVSRSAEIQTAHFHFSGGVMTTLDQLADAVSRALAQKRFQKTGKKPR